MTRECIPNSHFRSGAAGGIPTGWSVQSPRATLRPRFGLTTRGGAKVLRVSGNGREDCVGHLVAPVSVKGGQTYRLRVRFSATRSLDLHRSLVFGLYGKDFNNGVFRFIASRKGDLLHGDSRFMVPGTGPVPAEMRVTFRASASGTAWIERVSLEPCEPVPQRLVRVACTQGQGSTAEWSAVLDAAGTAGVDLVLLPEMMNGTTRESMSGPSARLMRQKARQHRMHVSGGIYFYDSLADRLWNRAPLGRTGRLLGFYDKIHPYSPEIMDDGVTPGERAPVFATDFGAVGILICYDSWFTDVAELLALRGAEIILFPNADYYRSLMPARSADNGVRFVASSLYGAPGMWDTARDVQAPDLDPSCHAREEGTFMNVHETMVGKIRMVTATFDLSRSPSPHNWGGPLRSAPGGRKNRRDQRRLLNREIDEAIRRG